MRHTSFWMIVVLLVGVLFLLNIRRDGDRNPWQNPYLTFRTHWGDGREATFRLKRKSVKFLARAISCRERTLEGENRQSGSSLPISQLAENGLDHPFPKELSSRRRMDF